MPNAECGVEQQRHEGAKVNKESKKSGGVVNRKERKEHRVPGDCKALYGLVWLCKGYSRIICGRSQELESRSQSGTTKTRRREEPRIDTNSELSARERGAMREIANGQ